MPYFRYVVFRFEIVFYVLSAFVTDECCSKEVVDCCCCCFCVVLALVTASASHTFSCRCCGCCGVVSSGAKICVCLANQIAQIFFTYVGLRRGLADLRIDQFSTQSYMREFYFERCALLLLLL